MHCIKCGEQIIDNSKFCSYCGTLQRHQKYDITHKKDTTPTMVGVILIVFYILSYFQSDLDNMYNYEEKWQTLAILSTILLVVRIISTVWVVKIAKGLNRYAAAWGFLAFFFPSITLIVIGQVRKLKMF